MILNTELPGDSVGEMLSKGLDDWNPISQNFFSRVRE